MKKIKIKIRGRPGWHLECSVMSQEFLKTDTLDIHAGGRDLIFPHHENEIAQSEALTGKPFAKYWIHHGLLTINGQKMAKSLGNFVTVKDVLEKYPPDVLKLSYLNVRYANPLDFSNDRLEVAKKGLDRIRECLKKINDSIEMRNRGEWFVTRPIVKYDEFKKNIDEFRQRFEAAMDDNFNTPQAMSEIFQIVNKVHIVFLQLESIECLEYVKKTIIDLGKVLGLSFDKIEEIIPELKAYVESKIKEREEARRVRDFKKADSIRKELEQKGIILEDTKDGKTTWRRKL